MGSSVILPPPGQPTQGPDPGFSAGSIPNIVTFAFKSISPPSPLYIQRDDGVVITVRNSAVSQLVTLSMRLLMPIGPLPGQPDVHADQQTLEGQFLRGWINIRQEPVAPTSDGLAKDFNFLMPECYLLDVAATSSGPATVRLGQTFVSVGVTRFGPAPTRFMELFSGNIANGIDIGWPGGPMLPAPAGPGFLHSLAVANPAAGADFALTAGATQRLRITSGQATFTASAAAANRQIQLLVSDGTNNYWTASAAVNVTAGQVVIVSFTGTNQPAGVVTNDLNVVLPPNLFLPPGHQVKTATGGIQAGDQWSGILFGVEEWIQM